MDAIFIGIKGTVVAIDRETGRTLWSTELKGADFVNVTLQDGALFAACRGRLYRLDSSSASCSGATNYRVSAMASSALRARHRCLHLRKRGGGNSRQRPPRQGHEIERRESVLGVLKGSRFRWRTSADSELLEPRTIRTREL
jgi:PQQ enzyme repeat